MIETYKKGKKDEVHSYTGTDAENWRDSLQPMLPHKLSENVCGINYNPFPYHKLGNSKIFSGFHTLAQWIIEQKHVAIEGYGGIFFEDIQRQIGMELKSKGFSVRWNLTEDCFKSENEILQTVQPYLGGENEVWGTRCNLELRDFFKMDKLLALEPDPSADINIIIGIGAALAAPDVPLVYFDIPKNEIQYRMRAGSINNLGYSTAQSGFSMYKRFYFVDWVVLNKHKQYLLDRISVMADGQQPGTVNWMLKKDFDKGLSAMGKTAFRARPWFEKGSWGGQWMKDHLSGLNTSEVNYAWSFELITPENGLVFESDGNLLEVSFDFLMMAENEAVLGKHAAVFGAYFPIRFDFLDTFSGGNLSIQCHPTKKYIQEVFGEEITQDETYYIMDSAEGAEVYLGFQESIDKEEFRTALEESASANKAIEIEKYVRSFPSQKHDLFLIPNGTVHSSGKNNMVLEISATPYIFTFKMYDWLSLDLEGNPRPINIKHAFNNLNFERKGDVVDQELISHPVKLNEGEGWQLVHLPTHKDHFYDIHRLEFDGEITIMTENVCHVLMLVEGTSIAIKIGEDIKHFNYAETFIVPAAVKEYTIVNQGANRAKVIKAFLKNDISL